MVWIAIPSLRGQADALQMFETAFREYEQARGGTLPMADDQVLETYLGILLAAEKDGILGFAEKEEFFQWAHYPPPPASLTPLLESMLRDRPAPPRRVVG